MPRRLAPCLQRLKHDVQQASQGCKGLVVQEALSVFGGEVKEVRRDHGPLEREGETGR